MLSTPLHHTNHCVGGRGWGRGHGTSQNRPGKDFVSPDAYQRICVGISTDLPMNLSFCLPLCRSMYLSICLSVSLSIHPSICLSVFLFIHLSVCQFVYSSMYLSVRLSINPSIYLSICIYLSVYRSVCLSVCLSIHLPICLPPCLSVFLTLHKSIHQRHTYTSTNPSHPTRNRPTPRHPLLQISTDSLADFIFASKPFQSHL